MAVTVTDDTTVFNSADAVTGWSVTGFSQPAVDPDAAVQGTNCIEARGISGGGIGTITHNRTNVSFFNGSVTKAMYAWARQSWIWATVGAATPGVGARISSSANGQTNFNDWATAGQDRGVTSFKGWVNICQDPKQPPVQVNGTAPELANSGNGLTQIPTAGLEINFLTGNNKTAALIDEVKFASELVIGGGTTADPGTAQEISSNDETNGDGFFKNVGGVFFVNIGLKFGNLASASSEFRDEVRTLVFEDWDVAVDFFVIAHLGNATGTNNFQLGLKTGTGVDEVGSNGWVIQSAGLAPWHIHCENANTDLVGYYGCTFIGPSAFGIVGDGMREVFREDNSAASFTYLRYDTVANDTNTPTVFPAAPAVNDAIYFGNGMPWHHVLLDVVTAKNGTYTITWEYWNGSAWAAVSNFRDGTAAFANTGLNFVTWDVPDDWATTAVNSRTMYWVRARISAFTSSTTVPTIRRAYPYYMPQMFMLTSSFEMITGTMIGMGSCKIRNGAKLKKVSLVGSVGTAMLGAVDLGSADPTANTVRDLTISDCARGMLVRGTSTGTTSYNLRNIQFSNNGTGVTTLVEDNSAGTFAFQTTEPNNDTANDTNVFPASPAVNDAFYVAYIGDLDQITINVGTARTGTATLVWEYWNGTAWTALAGLSDGTNGFTTTGEQVVSFTRPSAQTWNQAGSTGFFSLMIRCRISAFTSMPVLPLVTRVRAGADVRVDFPAGATVNLNILEGGSTPSIDNVNGSTVNVNNNVTINVQVNDTAGAAVSGARVRVEAQSDGSLVVEGTTNASGLFTDTFNFTSQIAVTTKVRLKGYKPFRAGGTLTSNGLDVGVTFATDTIVDLP